MKLTKAINQSCAFTTTRLEVKNWSHLVDDPAKKLAFSQRVTTIMSPEVTASLPEEWQSIHTIEDAEHWIHKRAEESHAFAVQLRSTDEIIGFLFLYEDEAINSLYKLRLGYLIAKEHWGKGLGSELIHGLVRWSHEIKAILSIVGGVDRKNIGSMRVLEKNGFLPIEDENTDTIFFEYNVRK